MFSFSLYSALAIAACQTISATPVSTASPLPTVDLGYVKQQASSFDQGGKFYKFNNIAFAQPPTGNLRWAAPQPPLPQKGVQNGGQAPIMCRQAYPIWLSVALDDTPVVPQFPYESEDCLYLDVFVPKKVFDRRNDTGYSAPVLVEIYGGGNVIGFKSLNDGTGLVTRGTSDPNSDGVIFVAMNYRLGYYGFLGGPAFRADGGTPNLGYLDQRFALQWVRDNIHKFGGDASSITLMGESGGALSVAYQITKEFSGNCSKPYKRAIMQSPVQTATLDSDADQDGLYHAFLKTLNVSNLAQARKLSPDALNRANNNTVRNWPQGVFYLGATNDGIFIKNSTVNELAAGNYPADIQVITSYNYNESSIFAPTQHPELLSNFTALVESQLPNVSPQTLDKLTKTLYPPAGPGTPYTDARGRAGVFLSDEFVNCNAFGYAAAFHNKNYAYKFSMASEKATGYHTQDLDYTFYPQKAGVNVTVAKTMQGWIMNFAKYGDPNHGGASNPPLPVYGSGHQLVNLTDTGLSIISDKSSAARCQFWNSRV